MDFTVDRASRSCASYPAERRTKKPCVGAWPSIDAKGWQTWKVRINSLDELMAFVKKYGRVVVGKHDTITIYDDYME